MFFKSITDHVAKLNIKTIPGKIRKPFIALYRNNHSFIKSFNPSARVVINQTNYIRSASYLIAAIFYVLTKLKLQQLIK